MTLGSAGQGLPDRQERLLFGNLVQVQDVGQIFPNEL